MKTIQIVDNENESTMTETQKTLIPKIIMELENNRKANNRPFDLPTIFTQLLFKSDAELQKIAGLCGIK